jgi:hypothetical protein
MFGRFNGQKVISLEEANVQLRGDLSRAMRENVLRVENTQNVLLDIRHTMLTCEEQRTKVLNDCNEKFKKLIQILKKRK